MDSLAIWYDPRKETAREANLELHLNMWKLPDNSSGQFSRFLDLGLMIDSAIDISKICLFLPSKLTIESIEDLGHLMVENHRLLSAIFNENYRITSEASSNCHPISNSKDLLQFYLYVTERTDYRILPNFFGGSIIEITMPKAKGKTYIRFRITDKSTLEQFSSIEKPPNSIFQSAFSKMETLDIRINEIRDLPTKLVEKIQNEGQFQLKKVHFFLMCSSREDYLFSHKPFIRCRKLENELWNTYTYDKYKGSKEAILAYHWKEKPSDDTGHVESFAAMVKTKYEHNNVKTIFLYLLVLAVLSIFFNISSSFLYDRFVKQPCVAPAKITTPQT